MSDYIVRATAADGEIRAFAAYSRDTVEAARRAHDTSPVVTAALGRLLVGGAMMGVMMKDRRDLLTLRIEGDGPVGGLVVTADAAGLVKGYANNPGAMLPPNAKGKLDVGGVVGNGTLSVIRDLGLKEPYVGQTKLATGEIGDDLTYYFAESEQTPSAVGLGVLMEKNNTVRQAGGFIVQLMPDAREETIAALEENLAGVRSVTDCLDRGMTPETLLKVLLAGLNPEFNGRTPMEFYCNCSRERVGKVLLGLGRTELENIIREGEETEVCCHFCGAKYRFSVGELEELLRQAGDGGREG